MRRVVLWDTACNFNAFISNQSIFNCLIIGASTLYITSHTATLIRDIQCLLCLIISDVGFIAHCDFYHFICIRSRLKIF